KECQTGAAMAQPADTRKILWGHVGSLGDWVRPFHIGSVPALLDEELAISHLTNGTILIVADHADSRAQVIATALRDEGHPVVLDRAHALIKQAVAPADLSAA